MRRPEQAPRRLHPTPRQSKRSEQTPGALAPSLSLPPPLYNSQLRVQALLVDAVSIILGPAVGAPGGDLVAGGLVHQTLVTEEAGLERAGRAQAGLQVCRVQRLRAQRAVRLFIVLQQGEDGGGHGEGRRPAPAEIKRKGEWPGAVVFLFLHHSSTPPPSLSPLPFLNTPWSPPPCPCPSRPGRPWPPARQSPSESMRSSGCVERCGRARGERQEEREKKGEASSVWGWPRARSPLASRVGSPFLRAPHPAGRPPWPSVPPTHLPAPHAMPALGGLSVCCRCHRPPCARTPREGQVLWGRLRRRRRCRWARPTNGVTPAEPGPTPAAFASQEAGP